MDSCVAAQIGMKPLRLTPARQRRIVALLQQGVSIATAANLSGICERTYHTWVAKADRGEEPYASFCIAASRARDSWKARLIRRIEAASRHDWKAASFLLERQFANEFSPKVPEPEIIYVEREQQETQVESRTTWHIPSLEHALTPAQSDWLKRLPRNESGNEQTD